MKRLIQFMGVSAILWTLLTITACSSDDDDDRKGNGGASDIVGNWFLYDEVEPEFYSFKKNGNFIFELCGIQSDKYDYEWVEEPGNYWANDGDLVLQYSDKDIKTEYYEYKIKRDVLTLTDEYGNEYRYERTDCKSLEECLDEYGL